MSDRPTAFSIALGREIVRQDATHGGYPASRDGVRLGIATIGDEVTEAFDAWREGRCKCSEPACLHGDWREVHAEIVQAAAVAARLARSIEDQMRDQEAEESVSA